MLLVFAASIFNLRGSIAGVKNRMLAWPDSSHDAESTDCSILVLTGVTGSVRRHFDDTRRVGATPATPEESRQTVLFVSDQIPLVFPNDKFLSSFGSRLGLCLRVAAGSDNMTTITPRERR
jgi:hypothetical protein